MVVGEMGGEVESAGNPKGVGGVLRKASGNRVRYPRVNRQSR